MSAGWGTWGWAGLVAYIAVYDTWALLHDDDTLTAAFARALAHPLQRWPVVVVWSATTLHLFGRLPFDPLHGYASVMRNHSRNALLALVPPEE